jgi:hypothetical protein
MMTQGQSMHNNLMGGQNQGGSGQTRGYSPSKPKWKQAPGQNQMMQYPQMGHPRKKAY